MAQSSLEDWIESGRRNERMLEVRPEALELVDHRLGSVRQCSGDLVLFGHGFGRLCQFGCELGHGARGFGCFRQRSGELGRRGAHDFALREHGRLQRRVCSTMYEQHGVDGFADGLTPGGVAQMRRALQHALLKRPRQRPELQGMEPEQLQARIGKADAVMCLLGGTRRKRGCRSERYVDRVEEGSSSFPTRKVQKPNARGEVARETGHEESLILAHG